MGLFAQEEQGTPDAPRGGFLKRFRAPRSSFIEPGTGAEPKFAAGEPVAGKRKRREILAETATEQASRVTTRAVNPQVTFLGRALSGGDIEDVESTEVGDDWHSPAQAVPEKSEAPVHAADDEVAFRPFVPPSFERPTFASMSAAMAAREHGVQLDGAASAAESVAAAAQFGYGRLTTPRYRFARNEESCVRSLGG
ncbi:hypothetical protein [Caballeronia cordobensis]|uniref:hypothetical protein n=1 Tax=Caballeronia cordobensis TaxID=1353886 RepID=UPI00045EF0C0|nr:hypothetical protein BRPE67_ECDS04500 [Burkholderia sp. RPE67]